MQYVCTKVLRDSDESFNRGPPVCYDTHAERSHMHVKDPAVHASQNSMDYGNTKNNPAGIKSVRVFTKLKLDTKRNKTEDEEEDSCLIWLVL